jgi:ABC-2 type transport system permease protein
MLLFVYLFGGAIRTGGDYVDWVVPGVLVLCAGFAASLTAVSVSTDMNGGIVDRLRSLDVGAAAILSGHVVAGVLRNTASTAIVLAVALLIGFSPHASVVDWLAAAAILLAFVTAFSWLSAVIGLVTKSPEAASGFTFLLVFLPYPSSGFVPIDTMPSWLQSFAQHQPITPIVDSLRGLLLGTPLGDSVWVALAWCGAILVAAVGVSGVLFRLRTR